jgi:Rrf2 family cysteine metabolism transcriptional repressor
MKLSTRTRYGLRAILELAMQQGKGPLRIKTIAQSQEISRKYLEQLITTLKSSGIVKSVRGPKGGYFLAKNPAEITLYDLFKALEGPKAIVECLNNKDYCPKDLKCVARQTWAKLQKSITEVLKSITMQDLVDKMQYNDKLERDCHIT